MGFDLSDVCYSRRRLRVHPPAKAQESEHDLLRDMLFILQGIDGSLIKFLPPKTLFSSSLGAPTVSEVGIHIDSTRVPQATQVLLHQLAELGWLFKRISDVLEDQERRRRGGLTLQSLYFALEHELKNYYRLIAVLESRLKGPEELLRSAGPENEEDQENSMVQELDPSEGLTLRRMAVWTSEMKLRMRMMGALVDGSERKLRWLRYLHTQINHHLNRNAWWRLDLSDPHIYFPWRPFHSKLYQYITRTCLQTILHCTGSVDLRGRTTRPFRRVLRGG